MKVGAMKNTAVNTKKISREVCFKCGKKPVSSYNRPNSLHKTKRIVKPNLQVYKNNLICTQCLKARI